MRRVATIWIAAMLATVSGNAMSTPTTQKEYRLVRSAGQREFHLELRDAPVRAPAANEVLVQVHAASLNRRDVFVVKGQYPIGNRDSLVPLSDGAGEVVAIGAGVKRFKVGDHVAAIFFQKWINGRPGADVSGSALGGGVDGMLAQYVTLSEEGLVKLPSYLTFEEASTLPCAGLTAYNGLFTRGRMQPGDYVLLEGTGGVSVFGLKLAVAAGAKPIITSSSDEKLTRAKALGAIATINYKTTPDWEKPAREATGGVGVSQLLEVGGKDTLKHAIASLGPGAHIALIGGLGGFGGDIPATALMNGNITVSGIYVGSRENFEAMNVFLEKHKVKPVVDKVVDFKEAQSAYDLMESDQFFGKIVIKM